MARDWSQRKRRDPYWRAAKSDGFRSRAAYKLLQLNDKFKVIRRGATVIDLGASPGGWSQVARQLVGREGRVVALDVAMMPPIPGVEFLRADVTTEDTFERLTTLLPTGVDVVISDMAPNISGNYSYDHARSAHLVGISARLAARLLKPGGCLLAKLFSGDLMDELRHKLAPQYERVKVTKPAASRSQSAEVYLLASGFRGVHDRPAESPAPVAPAGGAGGAR